MECTEARDGTAGFVPDAFEHSNIQDLCQLRYLLDVLGYPDAQIEEWHSSAASELAFLKMAWSLQSTQRIHSGRYPRGDGLKKDGNIRDVVTRTAMRSTTTFNDRRKQ